jgi:hypothetical protein
MAGNQVSTSPFSDTYDSEAYPLGATRLELATEVRVGNSGVDTAATYSLLDGDRVWIFVQAAAAIAAGSLCKRNALTTPFVVAEDAASETNVWPNLVGIADHAIASGSYGWIIKSGACVVEAETASRRRTFSPPTATTPLARLTPSLRAPTRRLSATLLRLRRRYHGGLCPGHGAFPRLIRRRTVLKGPASAGPFFRLRLQFRYGRLPLRH